MAKKPGPKVGQKHSGQFAKGDDPRRHIGSPWGRQKQSFQDLCKDYSQDAVEVLAATVRDESASLKERIACCELLISHGHGRPVDRVQVQQLEGMAGKTPESYSLPDLRAWAATAREQEINAEYVEVVDV